MEIYCIECAETVDAELVDGSVIYPHRPDLSELPFWQCPTCNGYVGTHHKTSKPTKPLGVIPNAAMRTLRSKIHSRLDPLWQSGRISRSESYKVIAKKMGIDVYHTGNLSTLDDAERVLDIVIDMATDYRKKG